MIKEEQIDYLVDLVENGDSKDWKDAVDRLGLNVHPDTLRKAWAVSEFSGYSMYKYMKEKTLEENLSEEELDLIMKKTYELNKTRKRTQRVTQQLNKIAREDADRELYREKWIEAIENEAPIEIKIIPHIEKEERVGLLVVSDAHFGKNVVLKGLNGEIINEYSPEIFKDRMWSLLSKLKADKEKMEYDKLIVFDTGDCIEGILRHGSSIKMLALGVIESANHYATFMSTWICELYNQLETPIEFHMCGGNHDVLRLLTNKPIFDEDMGFEIHSKIKDRLEINKLRCLTENGFEPDITIADYSEVIYKEILGTNILAYHGSHSNLESAMEFFENYYGIQIDLIIGGHLHRGEAKTVGFGFNGDREIIRVPSIVGADTYAKSILRGSRAGSNFYSFTEDGKEFTRTYYLN